MSSQKDKVIGLILQERFGDVVQSVGNCLFQYGSVSLLSIRKETNLRLSKIKESLAVLLNHSLVTTRVRLNVNVYTLLSNRVLLMLRYPAYINLLKRKFGVEAEFLMEEILQKGCMTDFDIIETVSARLSKINKLNINLLKDKINSLKIAKYLIAFDVRDGIKEEGNKIEEITVWTVNFDRFHQDMRDEIIVKAFETKFDPNAAELIRLFIQQMYIRTEPWAHTSNPIPTLEVKDLVRKMNTFPQLLACYDQYISVIDQDNCKFMRRAGESGGGSYQLCMKQIFTVFVWEICEQVILEKYDIKAARIFRLVKSKQYIESDRIQKLAMIPAKESKRICFELVEENFFQIREVKKAAGGNSGPSKAFILFYINLNALVKTTLELCYKSLFNIMSRRAHVKFLNKRIIDRKERIDAILLSMKSKGATQEQLQDIEDILTPPEREQLEKIQNSLKKINMLELEIDKNIFYLELFLQYQ